MAPRPTIREVPYDQPFAFVADTVLFTGIESRDTTVLDRAGLRRIRETIAVPLATLGWFEVEPERARFRIAVLHLDGPRRHWREWPLRQPTRGAGSCWELAGVGGVYRGFAIERVSDGAVFSRLHRGGALDAGTAEEFLGRELMKLVLLQNPGPDAPAVSEPPVGALLCRDVGADLTAPAAPTTPSRRPPPVIAPPIPTPTRKPCCD